MFLSLKYSNIQNIITSLEEIETNSAKTKMILIGFKKKIIWKP